MATTDLTAPLMLPATAAQVPTAGTSGDPVSGRVGTLSETQRATCRFCQQIDSNGPATRPEDVVIAATDSCLAWPSIGSLVEGWLLVVPRRHVLATAALSSSEIADLRHLAAAQAQRLVATFGLTVYQFEHGPAEAGSPVGCSVDHAHVHLVPLNFDLLEAARRYAPDTAWTHVRQFEEVQRNYASGLSYLHACGPDGNLAAFGATLPSQFFRRVIANYLNLGDPEWRRTPRTEVAQRTIDRLTRAETPRGGHLASSPISTV